VDKQTAIEALEGIVRGEGRYDRDQLTHASNVIEDSKQAASEVLAFVREAVSLAAVESAVRHAFDPHNPDAALLILPSEVDAIVASVLATFKEVAR
jgi:hypothetical protein